MIEILFLFSGSVAIIAGSGQLRALIKAGRSDELSLATWSLWVGTQSVALLYTISIHDLPLILFNSLWVALYGSMAGLIVYYRKYPRQDKTAPLELIEETA